MPEKIRVGVIGCGAISAAYFEYAAKFPILEMAACADINPDAAKAKATQFGIPRVCSVDELLDDPTIEVVLNLTVPKAHVPIGLRAIEKGKHTFSEKPLGIHRDEGRKLMTAAKARGVRVGCAPDTFLGAGVQTARKVIDDGGIGRPVAFTAFMLCPGHESWHPSPEFYYELGGGPMFDMGPYYLTALMNYLGAPKRIFGSATIAIPVRTIGSEPKRGKKVMVETPDHICGLIEFAGGASGAIMTSFATPRSPHPPITIFGTEGILAAPDPNGFDGPVRIQRRGEKEWQDVPHAFPVGYGRALGLADMATAIRNHRPHRCSLEQAYTVLDLMQGFLDSSQSGQAHSPTIPYERPKPMPTGLPFGVLD